MYFPSNESEYVDHLLEQYNTHAQNLHRYAAVKGRSLNVLPHTDIRGTLSPQQVALIEEGVVYASKDDKTAFVLQPGDFIFHCSRHHEEGLKLISEDCVTIKLINARQFHIDLSSNPDLLQNWQTLLLTQSALFANAYAENIKSGIRPTAGFLHLKPGDTIIRQGDNADEVFTLLKGKAKVISGRTEVGHILEGEIFGALAALTNAKRNASVIADTECTLMSVPKSQFIDLVRSRPETCLEMINTMARQITELNTKLQQQNDPCL